ncbi:MAG: hypothetical protein ACOC2W_00450 [bacterium]
MYRLTEDIVLDLKQKFTEDNIEQIIQHIFMYILEKTLKDGSCHIREFGKFIAFKSYSNRIHRSVIRFKFKPSMALMSKLNNDEYILNNIPVKSKIPFNEEHAEKCKNSKDKRQLNIDAQNEADRLGKQRTIQNVNTKNIIDIINEYN